MLRHASDAVSCLYAPEATAEAETCLRLVPLLRATVTYCT